MGQPATSLPLLALLFCACSDFIGDESADQSEAVNDTDAYGVGESPPDYSDTDSAPMEPVLYWSVSGQLTLNDVGEVDPTASAVEVRYWTATLQPDCADLAIPVDSWVPVTDATSEEGVQVLFSLETTEAALELDEFSHCPAWPGGTVQVGMGDYDGSLDPAIDSRGLLGVPFYGFYFRPSETEALYLLGIAGTEDRFLGAVEPPLEDPIPPGTYLIESLITLDL